MGDRVLVGGAKMGLLKYVGRTVNPINYWACTLLTSQVMCGQTRAIGKVIRPFFADWVANTALNAYWWPDVEFF